MSSLGRGAHVVSTARSLERAPAPGPEVRCAWRNGVVAIPGARVPCALADEARVAQQLVHLIDGILADMHPFVRDVLQVIPVRERLEDCPAAQYPGYVREPGGSRRGQQQRATGPNVVAQLTQRSVGRHAKVLEHFPENDVILPLNGPTAADLGTYDGHIRCEHATVYRGVHRHVDRVNGAAEAPRDGGRTSRRRHLHPALSSARFADAQAL